MRIPRHAIILCQDGVRQDGVRQERKHAAVTQQKSGVQGVAKAAERYGEPVMWERTYPVSAETFMERQTLEDRRTAEVVLLVRRRNGRYLLHTKAFYPPGTYRLLSGGVTPGEDLVEAALREGHEETGLRLCVERFVGVLRQRFVHGQDVAPFTSYLFLLSEDGGDLGNTDTEEQITGFCEVPAEDLPAVAEALGDLPPEWAEWGRFRAEAHRLAAHVLLGDERL